MILQHLRAAVLSRALSVRIRAKILGIALGLVLLMGFGVIYIVRHNFHAILAEELVQKGAAVASDVAGRSAVFVNSSDLLGLTEVLAQASGGEEDIRYLFVLDRSRDILIHTFEDGFPADLLGIDAAVGRGERYAVARLDTEEEDVLDVAVPVSGGGFVHVGMSTARIERTVNAITRRLLLVTGVASVIGVLSAYLLTGVITHPIAELVSAADALGKGDFERRASSWSRDEIGHLSTAFNHMAERLAASHHELRQQERLRSQLLNKIITAQEEERRRVARELHDQTSQSITSLMVGLRTAAMAPDLDAVRSQLRDLRGLAARTLDEIHALSLGLRPSVLDDLGLVAAIERYVGDFSRQFQVAVDYHAAGFGDSRLPPLLEITLYRIAQEALVNAARHGDPDSVSIVLERRDGHVILIVEDDGKGFDLARVMESELGRKLGLFGMQERVTLVGGTLTIESSPGQGTSVFAEAPIAADAGAA